MSNRFARQGSPMSGLFIAALLAASGMNVSIAHAQEESGVVAADRKMTDAELLADFLHYVRIDRADLAGAMGTELLGRGLSATDFAKLVETGDVERFDSTARRAQKIRDLEEAATKMLKLYEDGRLARARDPEELQRNIDALTGTLRGKLLAKSRILSAGEYAAPALLSALLDRTNPARAAEVQRVVIEMGRQAVIPFCTAMMELPPQQQELIANVIGQIPYRTSLPFLAEVAETTSNDAVKSACERAIARLGGATTDTAGMYMQLAEGYYAEKNELTSFVAEEHQLLWNFNPSAGLMMTAIRTPVFHEAMAMRCAERAMAVQGRSGGIAPDTVALWVASNFSREIDTPDGYVNPAYPVEGAAMPDATPRRAASYFGVAAGPQVAQMVLARAIDTRDTQLARLALESVQATIGNAAIVGNSDGRAPLVEALSYPNRRVQFDAALALAGAQPASAFGGCERVVPLLASTLTESSVQTAAVLSDDAESYQGIRAALESMGYRVLSQGRSVAEMEGMLAETGNVELVVSVLSTPDKAAGVVDQVRNHVRLSATPILLLTGQDSYIDLGRRYATDHSIMVRQVGLPAETLLRASYELVQAASGGAISSEEADSYKSRAVSALRDLAVSGNAVLNAADSAATLIQALPDAAGAAKLNIADVLSRIGQDRAQRALMDAALEATGDEQVALLGLTSGSAKRFGNMIDERQIKNLVTLARDGGDAESTAAAALMGSLGLPNTELMPLITGTK